MNTPPSSTHQGFKYPNVGFYFTQLCKNDNNHINFMFWELSKDIALFTDIQTQLTTKLTKYNKENKDAIAALVTVFSDRTEHCYWGNVKIRKSAPQCHRGILLECIPEAIDEMTKLLADVKLDIARRTRIFNAGTDQIRAWFYKKVDPQKVKYMESFQDQNEGVAKWFELQELCLTGKVTADNISQYGIEI